MKYVMGIDLGTSGVKAILVDESGRYAARQLNLTASFKAKQVIVSKILKTG